MKLRNWYTLLSWTWGLPLNLFGHAVALVLMLMGYKPQKWGGARYFVIGKNWGGLSIGSVIILCSDYDEDYIKNHEFGHSIQNCYFGFLCPFVVIIPSILRAGFRNLVVMLKIKKRSDLPKYESIWFERQATDLGHKYIEYWEK